MDETRKKRFRLTADQILPLSPGHGGCFATDMITVAGYRVNFMYRESPDNDLDSGWRFFSGFESEKYTDNPDNFALYDVNTIANYDRDIIPFLDAPIGSAFERVDGEGPLVAVHGFKPSQG
jgi:hypothetical protein